MDEDKSLACQLRQARADQEETLEQVHQQTGISLHVLRSLEAGQFTVVEPVYVRLALRTYAEYLGLNVASMVQQFEAIGYQPPPLPPPSSSPPRFSLARLWTKLRLWNLAFFLAVMMIFLCFWFADAYQVGPGAVIVTKVQAGFRVTELPGEELEALGR